uniref:Uncharacterized protein n=1 Tax=Arundo donax TaxID=35708 RepID=A0A0A9C8M0_ARUDO
MSLIMLHLKTLQASHPLIKRDTRTRNSQSTFQNRNMKRKTMKT